MFGAHDNALEVVLSARDDDAMSSRVAPIKKNRGGRQSADEAIKRGTFLRLHRTGTIVGVYLSTGRYFRVLGFEDCMAGSLPEQDDQILQILTSSPALFVFTRLHLRSPSLHML
jgi:hypothetical protein